MAGATTTTEIAQLIPVIKGMVQAASEKQRIFRNLGILEIPFGGPGSNMDLMVLGNPTAATYTEGAARTFYNNTETKVTVTPYEVDVAMSFTDKARKRSNWDLVALYGPLLARAVAQKIDADCAAEYTNFTGTAVDQGGTTPTWAKLIAAAGGVKSNAGDSLSFVRAALHVSQWDDLLVETANGSLATSAAVRGSNGAAISGVIDTVVGVRMAFSTIIVSAGGTPKYQNMLFNGRTLALGFKAEFEADAWDSRDNKAFRIAAGSDYDVATYFPLEGVVWTVTV